MLVVPSIPVNRGLVARPEPLKSKIPRFRSSKNAPVILSETMDHLRRPPKSAAEISELPTLGSTQCAAHVREFGTSFAPETLVYLIREATLRRDTALVEVCARFLIGHRGSGDGWEGGHCEPTISKLSRTRGFHGDRELRMAFRSGCLAKLAQALHAGRDAKPYWEERFGHAFKDACIDVARSLRRPRNRDMEAGLAQGGEEAVDADDFDPKLELFDEAILRRLATSHHMNTLLQAIRALPPRQAHAAFLAWVDGHPIEGVGDTVASIMGISDRGVYKHLEKARATLSADPGLRAIWFEEI